MYQSKRAILPSNRLKQELDLYSEDEMKSKCEVLQTEIEFLESVSTPLQPCLTCCEAGLSDRHTLELGL